MSGSGWVTTPSCVFGLLRSFLYISSLNSFYLFLILHYQHPYSLITIAVVFCLPLFILYLSLLFHLGSKSLQLCLTLWDPMDCSLLDSSVHGFVQARILEWVAIILPPPRNLPNPGIELVSFMPPALAGGFFTSQDGIQAEWQRLLSYPLSSTRKPFHCHQASSLQMKSLNFFFSLKYFPFGNFLLFLLYFKNYTSIRLATGFPGGAGSKEPACQCRKCRRPGFDPWVWKIPWRRAWQPLQYAWCAMIHRVTKSQTLLKQLSTHALTVRYLSFFEVKFSYN